MSKDNNLPGRVLDRLASLKLTLFLFFTLAAASIVGTLLPQGLNPAELQAHYSPAVTSIIRFFGLDNLYHTAWFQALLLLLCANLLACTIERLPKTIRLISRREEPFDSQKLSKFSLSRSISAKKTLAEARLILEKAVSESFGQLSELESSGSFCAVSEKGRWSRLMVYGVHLSVLVVLLGALLGSVIGFKGFINLDEGETSNEVILSNGENSVQLPFQIRCDKFDVSFYDTGAPKEFRSDVTIIDGGKEVEKEPIIVNDPLTYNGVTFYQASYGTTLRQAEIELKDSESGKTVTMTLPLHQAALIPGTQDSIEITRYEQNLMRRLGQALVVVIAKEGQQSPSGSWVLVDRPDFHGNNVLNYQIRVLRTDKAYYTGLQVKKDPGIWFVWIGFSLMIIGIGLTFYSSHTKIWVCAESNKKDTGTIVTVAGRSSRNAPGFVEKFDELCGHLENALKPGKNIRG